MKFANSNFRTPVNSNRTEKPIHFQNDVNAKFAFAQSLGLTIGLSGVEQLVLEKLILNEGAFIDETELFSLTCGLFIAPCDRQGLKERLDTIRRKCAEAIGIDFLSFDPERGYKADLISLGIEAAGVDAEPPISANEDDASAPDRARPSRK